MIKRKRKNSKGQAIVEYIIVIVIVAVAALTVMGIFSDRLRTLIAGVASSLGATDAASAVSNSSVDTMKNMTAEGIDTGN